ncbi:MAG: Ribose 5-phosphate isomerase A [Candidatus Bathyarchaeota archaeon B26-1]|nr:MAG: Ribose 5-phosphate isomerase A [Candidatus Bathyarchaeota archaeon B26-1]
MDWREDAKRRAALEAVKHVKDGFVVGLGSGSTAAFAIREIGRRIREENLKVLGVSTSYQSYILAVECGIPITNLGEHPQIDLDIDGADQIDRDLNLIKGGGGALLREKVVASAAKEVIIVADETKLSRRLGENRVIPLEVLPFAVPVVMLKVKKIGGNPRLREKNTGGPYITDNGNFILDVDFGPIDDPEELDRKLKSIPGIVETGLFIGMTNMAYIGTPNNVRVIQRTR